MSKCLVLTCSLLLAFVAGANAVMDSCRSDWGWGNVNCTTPRIAICPQGDFEFISKGCGYDNDYIWIQVLDAGGFGVPGVPWSDYWLQACNPAEELCICVNPFVTDSLTNFNGMTTVSGRIAAGGCVITGGLWLAIQGMIITTFESGCIEIDCEPIVLVTVDLTADCHVDLSDLGVFGHSYNKNWGDLDYNTCCDYNDDDMCNLSDFAFMGRHYQHECF